MNRKIFVCIAVALLSLGSILPARALFLREYTEDNPLVIVSDWEFPPYEFRNDRGEPDGYNIDILNLIFKRLNIPHVYHMKEWYKCPEAFEKREADLIHALAYRYKQHPYVMTQNLITYYNTKTARLKSTEPIPSIRQMNREDTLILKRHDYAALRVSEMNDSTLCIDYRSPREALLGIRNGKYKYFIWGQIPLQMKIKEFGLSDIELDDNDIPPGELRIIGYDKELIDLIDDTYARLEQAGELEKIRDKWFHPERIHNDTSPVALIVLIGVIIAGIIALLFSKLIRSRVKAAVNKTTELNQMMSMALNMGNYYVVEYDVARNILMNHYGDMLPEAGMNPQEFLNRMGPGQKEILHKNNLSLIKGEANSFDMFLSFNSGTVEHPDVREYYGNGIIETNDRGGKSIIYTAKDLTQDIHEERLIRETGSIYQRMFETNLVAMSFYDSDGVLIDVNQKMRELCEFDEEGEKFFREQRLFDVPLFKGQFDPTSRFTFFAGQHMYYPDLNIDKYIEFKIRTISDENDQLRYYIVTARDVTSERDMTLNLKKHEKEINKANDIIQQYEDQLHYLLENSNMHVWNSDLRAKTISFSRSLRNVECTETLDDYNKRMFEDERKGSATAINDPEFMSKPFNVIHHFHHTYLSKEPVWLAISGIPTYEKNGERIGYFGIARDITDLMEAQQKLKEETERAESSGKMKSAFLANMTHEIRTPLNAIVGFSDLLPMVDTAEERMEFIRIIRNNCDMLMRLINDILEASNMGQALAIKPSEVEFAQVFDDICQTLSQRVQEPGVEFIKDNPYKTYVTTLDKGRIQQLLTNFTTNAVKYTHEGHIKVGYRYEKRIPKDGTTEEDGLYFYCEDTGAGIPKEKQASVFERFVKLNDFVQGTGLGLSICQAITDRCHGHIGVTSEGEGHGSTFWVWIPCEKK